MKLPLTLIALCLTFMANTQITITGADVPLIGDVSPFAVDTVFGQSYSPSAAGVDQVWDFTQLQSHETYSEEIVDPSQTTSASSFPNSTGAIVTVDSDILVYLQQTNDALLNIGISGDVLDTGVPLIVPFEPSQKIFEFPSTYQTSYMDDYSFRVTIESPLPQADSIRVVSTATADVSIDAYGTLVSPNGTYEVLRQKRVETTTTELAFLIFGFWVDQPATTTNLTTYTFYNKEVKGRLLFYDVEEDGTLGQVSYSTLPGSTSQPPVALFDISGQNNNTVSFTDASQANITKRTWDFGDGVTVETTATNIDHTYSQGGTYTVCLTVENANGDDTACKALTIGNSNPPPVAAFSFTDEFDGEIQFTDLSTNDPITWLWDFGDGTTATEQNPKHTYTDAGPFTVCLIASNDQGADTTCQSVLPVFTPVANFQFTVQGTGQVDFLDNSLNTPTSWSWDFGDSNTSTEQNPVHNFSSGVYQVCLNVSNAAGSNENCQEVQVIISGLDDFQNQLAVRTFPNPSQEYLNIQITDFDGRQGRLYIYNSLGQIQLVQPLEPQQQIDLANWPAGTYYWNMNTPTGEVLARGDFIRLP